MMQQTLTFLKLGGSLITDKDQPGMARFEVIERLAREIASAHQSAPENALVLGHGSGSFGHAAAHTYGTRQGARTPSDWQGFVNVWRQARLLNQIVLEALLAAGLPVMAFPPSAGLVSRGGQPLAWDISALRAALAAGLVPVVNGDTVFDESLGGTIVSTEEVFFYLARQLRPGRILLAGREEGVWADYPACSRLLETITPATFATEAAQVEGSASVDVTGGMREKVRQMLALTEQIPGFSARIFSGLAPGSTTAALLGTVHGTGIYRDENPYV